MLTAAHGDSVERQAEEAGADLFLTKPFSPLDSAAARRPAQRAGRDVRLVTFLAASGGERVGELRPDHTIVELRGADAWSTGWPGQAGRQRAPSTGSRTSACSRQSLARRASATSSPTRVTSPPASSCAASKIPDAWYQAPTFYFSNPAAIFGPARRSRARRRCERLDFELEIAAAIGAEGADRRVHADERLERPRHPARGDDGRPRSREGQGLRDQPRPVARDAGRAPLRRRMARPRRRP